MRDDVKGKAMKPVLVFDYDGTLHETMRVYKPGIEGAVNAFAQS